MTEASRGLLIFDLDGTLFNGQKATVGAVIEVFEEHALTPPRADKIVTFFGKPTILFERWLASLCPGEIGEEVAKKVLRRERELVPERGELIEGVGDALHALAAAGHRMAISSNGGQRYVHLALESRGIRGYFEKIRWRMREDDRKPLMAKEILDAIPARPAAVIGDRRDDVQSGRENGIFAVGALYGFGEREELSGADAILEKAADLPGVIAKLFESTSPRE